MRRNIRTCFENKGKFPTALINFKYRVMLNFKIQVMILFITCVVFDSHHNIVLLFLGQCYNVVTCTNLK